MARLLSILTFLGLVALNPVYGEEPAGGWSQDVLQLFALQTRDEALQKILKQAKYPKNPASTEDSAGKIIAIRNDGLILPFYKSANYLDGHFLDLNGDGVIDYVDSYLMGIGSWRGSDPTPRWLTLVLGVRRILGRFPLPSPNHPP